jgi:uncharacterized Zn finger protein (UPF0148 family)
MARFRCRACGDEGTSEYDGRHTCPNCGSDDVQLAMMAAAETMNDYKKIRTSHYEMRLRPKHTLQRNMESRDFLARENAHFNPTLTIEI